MKIFGIQIGNTTPESPEDATLKALQQVRNKHHVPRNLNNLCLKNPDTVASLVFGGNLDEKIRERLLFLYSRDHTGSVDPLDNPRWTAMMRELIIPRLAELPRDFRIQIKWYQDAYGL